jgi:tRNA pseudouridine55 synthase
MITALMRTGAGPFTDNQAVSLETLEAERGEQRAEVLDHYLLPVEEAITHLREVHLPESSGFYLKQGQPVLEASALSDTETGEYVRVSLQSGEFLGVAEILDDGRVAPRRLVAG